MAGGFGYVPPAAPRPNSQQVGQALMMQGQAPAPVAPEIAPMAMQQAVDITEGKVLRQAGAVKMGAPGQLDDNAMPDDGMGHSPNAVNIAVGEALTRLGGGYKTNPNPHKDRLSHMRQLMQLGLSQTEAELLVATGGV